MVDFNHVYNNVECKLHVEGEFLASLEHHHLPTKKEQKRLLPHLHWGGVDDGQHVFLSHMSKMVENGGDDEGL